MADFSFFPHRISSAKDYDLYTQLKNFYTPDANGSYQALSSIITDDARDIFLKLAHTKSDFIKE